MNPGFAKLGFMEVLSFNSFVCGKGGQNTCNDPGCTIS